MATWSHAPPPSSSTDEFYERNQQVIRISAPVAPLSATERESTRSHTSVPSKASVEVMARRFDSKIEDLRSKRSAGVVRDYVSIAQLRHASVTRKKEGDDSLSSISATSSPRELPVSSKALRNHNNNSNNNNISSSNTHYKSSNQLQLHEEHDSRGSRQCSREGAVSPRAATTTTANTYGDSQTELSEIKQSVQRLRAQRAHVEQLRHHNERLELLATQRAKENEELRREIGSLRGVEQENVGLLQSFKLLEERLRSLEDICHEKRQQLKAIHDDLVHVETQRDHLEAAIQDMEHDHAQQIEAFRTKQTALVDRIRKLERDQDAFVAKQQRLEEHWREQVHHARQEVLADQQDCRVELEQSRKENKKLGSEVSELESQVQKLLATTVRQTSMIEDCDRALSEAKAQQKAAKVSYHDQLELNGRLKEQLQHLESQVMMLQIGAESDTKSYEKRIFELESKLIKRKERIEIMQVALHEKDKQLQTSQREIAVRDRNSEHLQEVNDNLKRREKTLLSEISELQIALGDATDEKKLLSEKMLTLQEQLEVERRDRSRWATARLKLLAEFCDEENKLSSALRFGAPARLETDGGDEALLERELDGDGDDDDDDDYDRRHGSVVFG